MTTRSGIYSDKRLWEKEPFKFGLLDASKGEKDPRSEFERDYGRVVHSGAFRRLQGKTQVVHAGHIDRFRTRLTHTLEVSQIGRSLARRIASRDSDFAAIVEVGCLIHDLGHPPFGHNGEEALRVWAASRGASFEANAQSFRLVTRLEVKFPGYLTGEDAVGLNLTIGSLLASVKYPWLPRPNESRKFGYFAEDADTFKRLYQKAHGNVRVPATPPRHPAAEIMDWADDVAYSVHDLEDGIRAKLIPIEYLRDPGSRDHRAQLVDLAIAKYEPATPRDDLLAILDSLMEGEYFDWAKEPYKHSSVPLRGEVKMMTSGLVEHLVEGLACDVKVAPLTAEEIHRNPLQAAEMALLKAINWKYVIDTRELKTMQYRERQIVSELCDAHYFDGEQIFPHDYLADLEQATIEDGADMGSSLEDMRAQLRGRVGLHARRRARLVADVVSGMTDRYAKLIHARIRGFSSDSISDLI